MVSGTGGQRLTMEFGSGGVGFWFALQTLLPPGCPTTPHPPPIGASDVCQRYKVGRSSGDRSPAQ
eukprot:3823334-Alexandrium_andersonii.AAC.1